MKTVESYCDCGGPDNGVGIQHEPHCPVWTAAVVTHDAWRTIKEITAERDALAAEVERLHGTWDCDGETHGPWCREWRKMEAEAGRLRSALAPATMTKLEAREVLSCCDSGYQQCAKCPALACCDNDAGRALLEKGGGA